MKMTQQVVFHSSLPPDTLLNRVRSNTDPYPVFAFWAPRHGNPLLGGVVSNGLSVRLRPRYFGKNAWGALFTGIVEPASGGSTVRGHVGPDHMIRGLLWFAFIFGLCVTGVMGILAFIPAAGFGFGGVVAGVAMTIWWVGLVAVLSLPHWPQRRRLLETVQRLVDGREA